MAAPPPQTYRWRGRFYALAYNAVNRSFLGVSWRLWLIILPLAAVIILSARGAPPILTGIILLVTALIQIGFWLAGRAGYIKFVPDPGSGLPPQEEMTPPLGTNEKVSALATGLYSVAEREDFVLLCRPAEYWRVPLGDHIVMVEYVPGRYRYQFFNAPTLQTVQPGWLIYGKAPRRTLAITYLVTFSPDQVDPTRAYYVGGGQNAAPPQTRTIYLTFTDEEDFTRVWHTIVHDARQARTGRQRDG